MKLRLNLKELEPDAYEAMYCLEKYLAKTHFDRNLRELIKIRASQLNGCAYCIEMHAADALKYGEDPNRIFALSAWWESPLFSSKEKALLMMTEEITAIADRGLTDDTFQEAKKHFTDQEIAQIIMMISVINVWNRMAVATHMFHEPKEVPSE